MPAVRRHGGRTGCGLLHQNPRFRADHVERACPPDYPAHRWSPAVARLWQKHAVAVRWRLTRRHGYTHLAPGEARGGAFSLATAPLVSWWRREEIDAAFPPWTGQGPLLDVGCASGVFLRQATEAGWRVAGIEIDPEAAARARTVTPEVFIGDPADAPFAPGSFDVVTSFHVVEHLVDPLGALRRMLGWLAPGGLLIVEVPNAGGVGGRLFGRHGSGLDFPRHLVHLHAGHDDRDGRARGGPRGPRTAPEQAALHRAQRPPRARRAERHAEPRRARSSRAARGGACSSARARRSDRWAPPPVSARPSATSSGRTPARGEPPRRRPGVPVVRLPRSGAWSIIRTGLAARAASHRGSGRRGPGGSP